MRISVVVNIVNEQLSRGSHEAIMAAVSMNKTSTNHICVWMIGYHIGAFIKEISRYPINTIAYMENKRFKKYIPERFLCGLEAFQNHYNSDLIIFTGDISGKELAARFAYRMKAIAFLDCTGLAYKEEAIEIIRPVYSGNLNTRYRLEQTEEKIIVSLRNGVFNTYADDLEKPELNIIRLRAAECEDINWLISKRLNKKSPGKLLDAKIVIAGGRGVGSREDFELLHEIAEKIGAAVGGSRSAVINDWLDLDALIGQSGIKISPKLVIAVGISGATPFMTGIEKAGKIVAINQDESAPIYNCCDLGLVGDYKIILNDLKEALILNGYE
jgi:electron transfer flavoprotein alpha subunit